jgi:hypothetical protein
MFRACHFVAAILCAVTYVCINPEHNPRLAARLQAMADAEALADALEASREAHVTIPLRHQERAVTAVYDGAEWQLVEGGQ